MTVQNFAVEHVPTRAERFWRALGFRHHHFDLPKEAEGLPGWAMTKVRLEFGMLDRLRLLTTGRLHLDIEQAMDARVDTVASATSWRIGRPFDLEAKRFGW